MQAENSAPNDSDTGLRDLVESRRRMIADMRAERESLKKWLEENDRKTRVKMDPDEEK